MLRDWILTLLVLSPLFLVLVIVLLAKVGRVVRHERARATIIERAHPDGGLS